MTDSIFNISALKPLETTRRTEDQKEQREAQAAPGTKGTTTPVDKVEISEEAVARQTAEAKAALVENETQTLGLDPTFDEAV